MVASDDAGGDGECRGHDDVPLAAAQHAAAAAAALSENLPLEAGSGRFSRSDFEATTKATAVLPTNSTELERFRLVTRTHIAGNVDFLRISKTISRTGGAAIAPPSWADAPRRDKHE